MLLQPMKLLLQQKSETANVVICLSVDGVLGNFTKQNCVRRIHHYQCLFNSFDINGKEKVHALEVFVVLAIHCAGNVTDKIEYCFKLFDFDNSNTISQTEMVMLCRSLTRGLAAIGGISDIPSYQVLEEISAEMFQAADTDHNNEISFEEFAKWAKDSLHTKTFMNKFSKDPKDRIVQIETIGAKSVEDNINIREYATNSSQPSPSLKRREHKINRNARGMLVMKRQK